MNKFDKVRALLQEQGFDAINLFSPENRFYFSGFTGTTGNVLITLENLYFITDFRYKEQAKRECIDFEIILTNAETTQSDVINQIVKKEKLRRIALEGNYISRNQWLTLEKSYHAAINDLDVSSIRRVKSTEELQIMEEAAEIADAAIEALYGYIKPGMTEKEVADFLLLEMKKRGATDVSFTTIVASGIRGSMPHGVASDKVIEEGDFVTCDFGALYKGYCSDITRTFVVGKEARNPELVTIYEIVREANQLGIDSIQAGMVCRDVDKLVRDFITEKGYGKNFGHNLGHSLGILVHEDPRLAYFSEDVLEVGNVVTIEPGIYVEGLGGVRIEDDVVITQNGCRRLTKSSKELKYIW